jgi:hypothetical protein
MPKTKAFKISQNLEKEFTVVIMDQNFGWLSKADKQIIIDRLTLGAKSAAMPEFVIGVWPDSTGINGVGWFPADNALVVNLPSHDPMTWDIVCGKADSEFDW